MMEVKEAVVVVSGRVQGVWFRASTLEVARAAGARGYVRNLPDGKVEALVQGTQKQIDRVTEFMKIGPPGARVASIEIAMRKPGKKYGEFTVTY